jgi:flagellar P-ring protein precursor FlgI
MSKLWKRRSILTFTLVGLWIGAQMACAAAGDLVLRIKDIARLEGVRANQITGLGLVVGLNGTGDSSRSEASIQMVTNILARYGILVNAQDLRVRNAAVVMVSAELPPFKRNGDQIDVNVASIGDAKSLQGGYLLQTPLTGADEKVYAVAQQALIIGGYSASGSSGSSQTKNHPTQAFIPGGAIVEREVSMELTSGGKVNWVLNKPDFTTASRLAETINQHFQANLAQARDMSLIQVAIPEEYQSREVQFIAALEALPVTPDGIAKVIVNERNGTIVVGEKVRISPVAVSHGNLTISIEAETAVSQPLPFSGGQTVVTQNERVAVEETGGPMVALPAGSTIGEIVQALNAVGTTPQDIIAILVAMDQAGALHGVLEVH